MAITLTETFSKFHWSKNPMEIKITSDTPGSTVVFYISAYGIYNIIVELKSDSVGNIVFDISGILDELLNGYLLKPVVPLVISNYIVQSVTPFDVYYEEYVSGALVDGNSFNTLNDQGDLFVLYGGIAEPVASTMDYFTDEYKVSIPHSFLTWLPAKQLVDKKKPSLLSFLKIPSGDSTVNTWCKVYNGAAVLYNNTVASFTPPDNSVLHFYAGWTAIGLDALLGTDAHLATHYEIWLVDGDDVAISDVRTYVIDTYAHKNNSYFIYQNSLNGYDDVCFTGAIELKSDTDRVTSRYNGAGFVKNAYGIARPTDIIEQYSKKINTGFVTPAQVDSLRTMLLSPRIYEVVNGANLVEVVLTENSKQLLRTVDYLNNISIEFAYANKNSVYTPISKL